MSESCGDCGAKIAPDNRVWDGKVLRCCECAEKCEVEPLKPETSSGEKVAAELFRFAVGLLEKP